MAGWVRMNGTVGCLPDSCEVYEDVGEAINAAREMFDDVSDEEFASMAIDLQTVGIHYFAPDACAGADYVSVEYDPDAQPDDES